MASSGSRSSHSGSIDNKDDDDINSDGSDIALDLDPSGKSYDANHPMEWLEEEDLNEEWIPDPGQSVRTRHRGSSVGGDSSHGAESTKATAIGSGASTDIIGARSPIGTVTNTNIGTVINNNSHGSSTGYRTFTATSMPGTVIEGGISATAGSEDDMSTTKFYDQQKTTNGPLGTGPVEGKPRKNKVRAQTPQWKRRMQKNNALKQQQLQQQNGADNQALGQPAFQQLFDPPTVDHRMAHRNSSIYLQAYQEQQQQQQHLNGSSNNTSLDQGTSYSSPNKSSEYSEGEAAMAPHSRAVSNTTTTTTESSASRLKLFARNDAYTNARLDDLLGAFGADESPEGKENREDLELHQFNESEGHADEEYEDDDEDDDDYEDEEYEEEEEGEEEEEYKDESENIEESGDYEEPTDAHTPSNINTQKYSTVSSSKYESRNSADRRGFTTQDFFDGADQIMAKIRRQIPPSYSSNTGSVFAMEGEEVEYTTSSYASETETSSVIAAKLLNGNGNVSGSFNATSTPNSASNANLHMIASQATTGGATRAASRPLSPSRYPSVIIHSQNQAQEQQQPQNQAQAGQQQPQSPVHPQSTTVSAPQSPERQGRRNMGIILRTDELALAIPKVVGSMVFHSKANAWYKVSNDKHGVDHHHHHHHHNANSNYESTNTARVDNPSSNTNNKNSLNSHPRQTPRQGSGESASGTLRIANGTRKISLMDGGGTTKYKSNTVSTSATTATPNFNSYSSEEVDVFSGIDDLESSRGTQAYMKDKRGPRPMPPQLSSSLSSTAKARQISDNSSVNSLRTTNTKTNTEVTSVTSGSVHSYYVAEQIKKTALQPSHIPVATAQHQHFQHQHYHRPLPSVPQQQQHQEHQPQSQHQQNQQHLPFSPHLHPHNQPHTLKQHPQHQSLDPIAETGPSSPEGPKRAAALQASSMATQVSSQSAVSTTVAGDEGSTMGSTEKPRDAGHPVATSAQAQHGDEDNREHESKHDHDRMSGHGDNDGGRESSGNGGSSQNISFSMARSTNDGTKLANRLFQVFDRSMTGFAETPTMGGRSHDVSLNVPDEVSYLQLRNEERGKVGSARTPGNNNGVTGKADDSAKLAARSGSNTPRNTTRVSMIGDLSYHHNKSRLVQVLTDRYQPGALPPSDLSNVRDSISMSSPGAVVPWDTLTHVNLSGSDLDSLMDLSAICPQLYELNVSHNKLSNILGIPVSVRALNVSHNKLTKLATIGGFRRLTQVRYLDLSYNPEMQALVGVAHLTQLTELNVEGCGIRSVSIFPEDGEDNVLSEDYESGKNNHERAGSGFATELVELQTLKLNKNKLAGSLDLKYDAGFGARSRLSSLDLRGNRISSVVNVFALPRLTCLNLDDNLLTDLKFASTKLVREIKGSSISSSGEKTKVETGVSMVLLDSDDSRAENGKTLLRLSARNNLLGQASKDPEQDLRLDLVPNLRVLHLEYNSGLRLGHVVESLERGAGDDEPSSTATTAQSCLETLSIHFSGMSDLVKDNSANHSTKVAGRPWTQLGFLRNIKDLRLLPWSRATRVHSGLKAERAGNLPRALIPSYFMNLQTLELPGQGLTGLSPEFADCVPNLRVANFALNGLSDGDLINVFGMRMPLLERLFLYGNKVRELDAVATFLAAKKQRVGANVHADPARPALEILDLRGNPVTAQIYPDVVQTLRSAGAGATAGTGSRRGGDVGGEGSVAVAEVEDGSDKSSFKESLDQRPRRGGGSQERRRLRQQQRHFVGAVLGAFSGKDDGRGRGSSPGHVSGHGRQATAPAPGSATGPGERGGAKPSVASVYVDGLGGDGQRVWRAADAAFLEHVAVVDGAEGLEIYERRVRYWAVVLVEGPRSLKWLDGHALTAGLCDKILGAFDALSRDG